MAQNKGFSLIEILISIAVFGAVVNAAAGIFIVSQESVQIARAKTKALFHLNDYHEKIKNIKRFDWTSLVNGRYLIADISGNWTLQTTILGETIDTYTRYIEIADARRDSSGNLVESGGTVDPSTKKITITVSWVGFKPGNITQSTYITRYLDNLAQVWTTKADFDNGTHSGTTSVNNAGGEVVLGAGGNADWCGPELTIGGLDLDLNGVPTSVTAIEGRAFATTGENASGKTFNNINITNTDPPVASLLGDYNGGKGNDVFGETNYAYIATDTPKGQVVILSIASAPYTIAGSLSNISGSGSDRAKSVFMYGNTGYVTVASKLYNFDVTNKTAPTLIDTTGVSLNGVGTSVMVVGSYAYVATDSTAHQLQIVDLSNPSNLTIAGSVDLDASSGVDLYVNSSATRAYVVTSSSPTQQEFFIIDISNKLSPVLISGGTYDTNGMSPRGIEIVPGGRAIIVGTGGLEYQVVNVANESSLVSCVTGGGMDVPWGIFDSASIVESDNGAFTYIVTGDAGNEFRIVEGGPGGNYSSSGIWESATFGVGNSTGFNRLDVTFDKPPQTDIKFQFSVVDQGVSGTCSDANFASSNFVGPSGDSSSYFQDDAGIPFDDSGAGFENPGRCARVRAYLETSDFPQTPALHDVTVNYSP